jgi:hypothetical protein
LEDLRRTAVAAAASLAVALAGCGGGGQRVPSSDEASAAVLGFAKAFGAGKGDEACALLTDDARAAFLKRVQALVRTKDCTVAMNKVHDEAGDSVTQAFTSATVSHVKVNGGSATATLTAAGHSTSVGLAEQDGKWKLTGVPGI